MRGTPLAESVAVAVGAMRTSPLRTLLSALGVVIGVGALVAILALSDGLQRLSRKAIEESTDVQTVIVAPLTVDHVDGLAVRRTDPPSLDAADVYDLDAVLRPRANATLSLVVSGWASAPGDTVRRATVVDATLPGAGAQVRGRLVTGRFLSSEDLQAGAPVVVVSDGLASMVSPDGSALDAPGRAILLADREWTIIGVVAGPPDDRLNRAWVALDTGAIRRWGDPVLAPAVARIRVGRLEDVPGVVSSTRDWLTRRFGHWEDDFRVMSNQTRADQARKAMLVLKLVLGAIAGISLVVGGIGIMNVLLASVSERTREIGLRKATGARPRDVRRQFLAESVTIAGIGSLLGIVLGAVSASVIALAIRRSTEAPLRPAFTWSTLLVAAGAALVVGLVFGTWPARRAGRLSPIDALRHE